MHLLAIDTIKLKTYFFDFTEVFGLLVAVFLLPLALDVLALAVEEAVVFFLACIKYFIN